MSQICEMISRRTGCSLLQVMVLSFWTAAGALAHPMGNDTGGLSVATSSSHQGLLPPAVLMGMGVPAGHNTPAPLPSSLPAIEKHILTPASWSASGTKSPEAPFEPLRHGADTASDPAGLVETDPLLAMPRTVLSGSSQPPLAAAPPGGGASLAHPAVAQPEEEIIRVFNELQESAREVIATAIDLNKGPQGRLTFSLAGVEGFHYSLQGGELTFGYGETSLSIIERNVGQSDHQRASTHSAHPASKDLEGVHELIELVKEILSYPLLWVILFFMVAGKVALEIARRRGRKRTHRRRSEASPQVKEQRIRKRIRLRSSPSSASIPQN